MIPQPARSFNAVGRYQDAYRVAKALNGFGQMCKFIGIVVGGLILIVIVAPTANNTGSSMPVQLGGTLSLIGITFGGLIAFSGWMVGVLISAQGQILKATLDSAINSSPFLAES